MPTKNNIQLVSGTLYFNGVEQIQIGEVTESSEIGFAEDAQPIIRAKNEGFEIFAERVLRPSLDLRNIWLNDYIKDVLANCPNRKVAHLARHGKNSRVRLKNWRRAQKLVEEGAKE